MTEAANPFPVFQNALKDGEISRFPGSVPAERLLVAVGFSPRNVSPKVRVAERRLKPPSRAFQVSLRDTAHLLENRGMKPTATVILPAGTTYFTVC